MAGVDHWKLMAMVDRDLVSAYKAEDPGTMHTITFDLMETFLLETVILQFPTKNTYIKVEAGTDAANAAGENRICGKIHDGGAVGETHFNCGPVIPARYVFVSNFFQNGTIHIAELKLEGARPTIGVNPTDVTTSSDTTTVNFADLHKFSGIALRMKNPTVARDMKSGDLSVVTVDAGGPCTLDVTNVPETATSTAPPADGAGEAEKEAFQAEVKGKAMIVGYFKCPDSASATSTVTITTSDGTYNAAVDVQARVFALPRNISCLRQYSPTVTDCFFLSFLSHQSAGQGVRSDRRGHEC